MTHNTPSLKYFTPNTVYYQTELAELWRKYHYLADKEDFQSQ